MSTPLRERPDAPLGTLIFRAGLLPAETIESALEEGVKTGKRLGEILTERGLISEVDLARLLAGQKGLEFVILREQIVDPAAASLFTEEQARLFRALPYAFDGELPVVAIADPTDEVLIRNIREALGREDARFVVTARGELAEISADVYSKPLQVPTPTAEAEPAPEPEQAAEPAPEDAHTNGHAPADAGLISAAPAPAPPGSDPEPVATEPEPLAPESEPVVPEPTALQVPADDPVEPQITVPEPIETSEPQPVALNEPTLEPQSPLVVEPAPTAETAPEPPAVPEPSFDPEPVALTEPQPAEDPEPPFVSEPPPAAEPEPVAAAPAESEPAPLLETSATVSEPVAAEPIPFPQPVPAPPPAPYPPAATQPAEEPDPLAATAEPDVEEADAHQPATAAAEASTPWQMTIRLTNGDRVEAGEFPDEPSAKQEAKAIMIQIAAADQDDWPFVSGRFLKPDTIVSVDIAEYAGDDD